MSKLVTIETLIDEALAAEVEQLASARGRSRADFVADALRSYVASEREFSEAVAAGLQDMRSGRLVDHDSVVAAVRRAIRPQT